MKHRRLPDLPGTPVSEASGSSGGVIVPFRETRRSRLLRVLVLAVTTFGILIESYGQGTNVFNRASGITATGPCGVEECCRIVGNANELAHNRRITLQRRPCLPDSRKRPGFFFHFHIWA